MPLDAASIQSLIVKRIGDVDPETGEPTTLNDGIVAANVGLLWDYYADKGAVSARLQEVYVRRAAIDMVLGVLAIKFDFTADNESAKLHQRVDTYQAKLTATEVELVAVEKLALGSRRPAVGQITTVEPVSPPPGRISGNSPSLTGSPYAPALGSGGGVRP